MVTVKTMPKNGKEAIKKEEKKEESSISVKIESVQKVKKLVDTIFTIEEHQSSLTKLLEKRTDPDQIISLNISIGRYNSDDAFSTHNPFLIEKVISFIKDTMKLKHEELNKELLVATI